MTLELMRHIDYYIGIQLYGKQSGSLEKASTRVTNDRLASVVIGILRAALLALWGPADGA